VLVERSELRTGALFGCRLDGRIALRMRRVEKLERNVGCTQIPERHEVVEASGASAVESRIIPPRTNRIMAAQAIPRQEADARMLVNIERDRRALLNLALYGECRPA
jgi:hypothetical protein